MSTDVIAFACKNCDRKIKVKAALAGRQAKCPGCGNPLRIPTPKPAAAAKPKKKTAAAPAPKPEQQDEFGLGNLEGGDEALFGKAAPPPSSAKQNPLANHVVADPGFAQTDHMVPVTPQEGDEGEAFARNPLLVQME